MKKTVYDSRNNCNAIIETKTNILILGCANTVIPDTVTCIGDYAFYYRDSLTRIIIPESVTSIGYDAFYGCDSLADVYYYGEEADWNNITIDSGNDCLTNAKIHFIKKITGLTLNKTTLKLEPNNATKLIATITPEVSTDIVWSSSDTTVATAENGGLKDFCLIKVVGITASSKLTTIDSENGLIYGITPGSTTLNDFVTLGASDYTLEYDNKFEKVGTGSVVNLICDDSVADSYTVVIFGDTDGDGWYNGQDAVMVSMLANGMLTREQVGEAVYMAADCNHDGVIDQADVDLLNQAGALFSNVDQTLSTEEMLETAAYKEYSELIDQTPTIDEVEDNTADENPAEETPTANNLWATIVAFLEKF